MKTILSRLLLTMALGLICSLSSAATYYFSSSSGDDSRNSAQAQNPDTPWKSISKLNSIFKSLKPGDKILFKSGDTFYGTIEISRSGNSGSPIVLGSYGSGAKPVITSLVTLKNWKSVGNGIYESTDNALSKEVNIVLMNQKIQEVGRHPNRDASNGGYLTITSTSGNRSVSSNELSSSSNFSGGEVVIRKNQWIIDRHKISSHSGNKINYSGTGSYSPSNGYGMFIQNHIRTLDKQGEWYYNGSSKKLNVHFGSSNPNSNEVQASSLDFLITKDYLVSNIRIENLHFNGANKDAIHFAGGTNIKINNVEVENSGENGITMMSVLNLEVNNTNVSYSLNNGINLRYGNIGAKVTNNVIENTFIFQGGGQNGDRNGVGIFVGSNNSLIEYNRITNTGFNGIVFDGNGTQIKNNFIDGYCVLKNDGGGIYSYGGTGLLTVFKDRKVTGNIILNGKGTRDGTPTVAVTMKAHSSGIFLDDNSNGIEVSGNTIANSNYSGIKIANSSNIVVKENTFYDSDHQVLLGNSSARGRNTRNIKINNNIFFSKHSDQYAYIFRSDYSDISSFGSFDQNYFARPFGDNHSITVSFKKGNNKVDDFLNLKRWQNSFNKDNSSKVMSRTAKAFEVEKLIGKNLFSNGSFDRNVNDILCADCKTSWASDKLDNGAIKVESKSRSDLRFEVGSVKKDKDYILKFKGISNKSGGLRIYLRYGGSPWELVSPSTTVELNNVEEEYTVLLKPYENVERTAVMLVSDEGNWTYWLDDIEFREAEVKVFEPSDKILFEYNPTKTEKTIVLGGTYVDAKNQTYSGKVTLAPYSSIVLLNTSDKVAEVPKEAPKVALTSPNSKSEHIEGATLAINAEASAKDGQIEKVEFFSNGKLLGSSNKSPFTYTWNNIPLGTQTITAVATDNNSLRTTSQEVQVNVKSKPADEIPKPVEETPKPGGGDSQNGDKPGNKETLPLYVTTGSSNEATFQGNTFKPLSKTNVVASSYTESGHKVDDVNELFQSSSYAKNLTYTIPVPDGKYTVKTYHSESYFGEAGPSAVAGQRVFDILIEGELMKDDFDIHSKSGNNEVVLTFENVEVKDGMLEIEMNASANNAIISGFAILPSEEEPSIGGNFEDALFINTGSTFDVVYEGNRFVSDYKIGSFSRSNMNTDDKASGEPLYQSYRFAKDLEYAIPVKNGIYTVITYHFENYFGKSGPPSRNGQRVFNIAIENQTVKNKFDMFAENGNEETVLTFEGIEVKDGVLNLDLTASANNALISGIAIIPMEETASNKAPEDGISMRINAGSYEDVEHNGNAYESEFIEGYHPGKSNLGENKDASTEPLYQTYRFGKEINYEIPLANGTYSVVTHHHETYFGHSRSAAGANKRVFDIILEGKPVKRDLDLFKESANEPIALQFYDVVVNDGILNLDMIASMDNATISGFEIWSGSGELELEGANLRTMAVDAIDSASEEEEGTLLLEPMKLYPNPAKDNVTLTINKEVGDFDILIHNMNGQLASQYDSNALVKNKGEYLIPVQHLPKGVYLVTLAGKKEILNRMRLIVTE